jgi:hypothetical protein
MSGFWLGVAETAIGSGIGFGLGILAFHYQQKRQAKVDANAVWKASLDALNRLTIVSVANIEALVNAKLHPIDAMCPEIDKMKTASVDIYDTPPVDRTDKLRQLKELSESLQHFYISLPRISVMPPPDPTEYSSLSNEMPALSLFVHRATGTMQDLNEQIVSRNSLIAEHAREGGIGEGMSGERLMYFSGMLADQGVAICTHVDDALDFWRLVADQVEAYMTHKAKGENIIKYRPVPKAVAAFPKDELFPALRAQLNTFEKP